MNRSILLGLVAVCAAPVAAFAAPAPAWTVDKAASAIRFTSSMGGESFTGAFRRWDADIRFDPANLAGSSVTASIDTTSAATGNSDRDQALPTPDFFAAAKFPRATFIAHSFTAQGGGHYQAVGQLTLRGVTKPLTLPFTLVITGAQAKMNATIALNRLAFGVGQGQWSTTEAIPGPVTVSIALSAKR